ncbi:hypothetical protein RFI_07930 [Reticulomyxa filosa]|uniref:Uncharacterized protein n=1 Tax=Reticulomyxa filosa TaxID=46433 RepID=X6NTT8_RETFI|nr:hypothetical protein RFI_07930 [Reticulomyxa filosa]|eukprot:ETO29199.1 hypothetical protein RFI_07930 [Reticulomyxa filosa]
MDALSQFLSQQSAKGTQEIEKIGWHSPNDLLDDHNIQVHATVAPSTKLDVKKITVPPPTYIMIHELQQMIRDGQLLSEWKNAPLNRCVVPLLPKFCLDVEYRLFFFFWKDRIFFFFWGGCNVLFQMDSGKALGLLHKDHLYHQFDLGKEIKVVNEKPEDSIQRIIINFGKNKPFEFITNCKRLYDYRTTTSKL